MTLPFGSRVVYAGDSITIESDSTTSPNFYRLASGYVSWAQAASSDRLYVMHNGGVGGNSSAQLLARYTTDVIAYAPHVVVLEIGTNDVGGVTSNPGIISGPCISNIAAMIAANQAIGAKTILLKILPRGSVASPLSANQITCWETVNNWIATQAAADVVVIDCESQVGNMDAIHSIKTGFTISDNLHPCLSAAKPIGEAVGAAINGFVSSGSILFTDVNDARNLCPNPFLTGNSSGIATGYSSQISLGGGAATYSKVARNDGFGEWQQIALSGTYTGNSNFTQLQRTFSLAGALNNGDVFEYVGEFQVGALVGVKSVMFTLSVGGLNFRIMQSVAEDLDPGNWNYTLRSLPGTMIADAVNATIVVNLTLNNTATTDPVSGTVKIGRLGIRKAPLSRIMRATWT